MSLENAQSATIQSDATRPSLWAGRVFHRVHGEVDPTGCFRALPRRVKRILGLYNYRVFFFLRIWDQCHTGRPQSAVTSGGSSEPWRVGVRLSSVSCLQIGMGTANVHLSICLCSGTQETTNAKVKVLCLHSNPNPVPVSMNHVSRGHEMGCARMIREVSFRCVVKFIKPRGTLT